MRILSALTLLAAAFAAAADDPWARLRDVKSGSELRVFRNGSPRPVLAAMDELTDDNLVVVIRNEQVAIPRDKLDRVDARPRTTLKDRVTRESQAKSGAGPAGANTQAERMAAATRRSSGAEQGSSSSGGLSLGGKPDFETVYRRMPRPAAANKP